MAASGTIFELWKFTEMKGINTPGQAMESGGVASSWAPARGGVFHLAFPALARDWNHQDASPPLASLGNEGVIK